jgi:hypothetical protein
VASLSQWLLLLDLPHRFDHVLSVNYVVAVEYAARFVPAYRHRHLLVDARLHQVPNRATAEVMHD